MKKFIAAFLVHLMSQNHWNWFLNEQDIAYGSEGGENVRFKHKLK
jgi:hypothetical protein